jgi:hypothetical protein
VVVFATIMLVLIRYIHFDSHLMKVNWLETMQLEKDEQGIVLAPDKARATV